VQGAMMLDHLLDTDSNAATRRYSKACDVRAGVYESLQSDVLGVHWEASEVDPDTFVCRINGFDVYCGTDLETALLSFAGALQESATIVRRISRDLK